MTRAGNLKVWVALLAAAAVAAGILNSTVKPAHAAFSGIPNAIAFFVCSGGYTVQQTAATLASSPEGRLR